jgi:hypothetical protein
MLCGLADSPQRAIVGMEQAIAAEGAIQLAHQKASLSPFDVFREVRRAVRADLSKLKV